MHVHFNCRTVFVSGTCVVGFGELFKTSFLIDPTGIKLSSFQGSLPNLGTAYRTFCNACIVMFVVFIVIFLQVQLMLIDFLEAMELAYFVIGS